MSQTLPLPFHVYDDLNKLRARVHYAADAAALVAFLGDGAHVMSYHRGGASRLLWKEGKETASAADSYDAAAETMRTRRAMSQDAFARDWLDRHERGEV